MVPLCNRMFHYTPLELSGCQKSSRVFRQRMYRRELHHMLLHFYYNRNQTSYIQSYRHPLL
jgi:hypothetical protein